MVGLRQAELLRSDVDQHGKRLSAQQREQILKPFLPDSKDEMQPNRDSDQSTRHHPRPRRKPIRSFVKAALHIFIFNLMQAIFSVYHKVRKVYRKITSTIATVMYHHHRTPELIQKDVRGFKKLPNHLSIILSLDGRVDETTLETLVNEVCECVAWTACAGIPTLSIYERTGVLKSSLPHLHRQISNTLTSYYGVDNAAKPTVSIRAPQIPAFSPPSASPDPTKTSPPHLSVLMLSESDGRRTLVDLTKTLAEMSQKHKLNPEDISMDLIDAELSEGVMDEPDLLILFSESVVLDGYPPWQIRLSEIFHIPDNHEVTYRVFLRGLQKYAGAQMRFGS